MLEYFKQYIHKYLPKHQIIENELLRYAYSTDASVYRLVPKLVLIVKTNEEIIKVITYANRYRIKLTFRAAGTSLSGQAVTDQVLVMLASDSWLNYQIIDNGNKIMLEPSIVGLHANNYLKPFGRKIGPDPASIGTAKLGGIIANNSSGMCCGTSQNSYATIESMKIVFYDGYVLDTSNTKNIENFKKLYPNFITRLLNIRDTIVSDNDIIDFIKKKFAIKNTSGYSLNSFIDYSDPIKIIERLLIGSEGTLGFVSSVTLNTVVDPKHKALNLIYGELDDLIKLTETIKKYNPSAVELLDYSSLESVKDNAALKPYMIELKDNVAAIMIEVAEENTKDMNTKINDIGKHITENNTIYQTGFKTNESEINTLWSARKGILPSIAAKRPNGSSLIIEDFAVNISDLANLVKDVNNLFKKYNYEYTAIFGHVLDGNIHCIITPNFSNSDEVITYDKFMHDITNTVVSKYNGSLKAEHGSGRNISPFAVVEWGEKCWDIMWQIKKIFDPNSILNPDVKITKDSKLHLKNLKEFTSVNDEIDKCIECGFCEPVCPSRNLSLTPRQRNSVARKMETLSDFQKKKWNKDYNYYAVETCAKTSLCKNECPVGIDIGAFMLSKTPQNNNIIDHAQSIKSAKLQVKAANITGEIIGKKRLMDTTRRIHSLFKSIPIYLDTMPEYQQNTFSKENSDKVTDILLLPTCPNRIFADNAKPNVYSSQAILEKLGFTVKFIEDAESQCCGQIYHSQNNHIQQEISQDKLIKTITNSEFKFAVSDNSSCSSYAKSNNIPLIDINRFIIENIDITKLNKKYKKLALHLDCSTRKLADYQGYLDILKHCCDELVIPERIYCCGFAGDKGFKTPELNASSLVSLQEQVKDCDIGVSFNRTCQIGLEYHSGVKYLSFINIILECLSADI